MTRSGEEQRPMYLTEVGRRHLEDRLGEYGAQRARLTAQSTDPTDVQDSVDQSDRLEAADELARLDDQIAHVQDTLRRALPLPAGAADGVIRLGSTVRMRDDDRVESSFTLLDAAELTVPRQRGIPWRTFKSGVTRSQRVTGVVAHGRAACFRSARRTRRLP